MTSRFTALRCDAFSTATRTFSTGMSISAAAISACCCGSSVSPLAAKIASSSVGGSSRTLRGPYLVFQALLMVGTHSVGSRRSEIYCCDAQHNGASHWPQATRPRDEVLRPFGRPRLFLFLLPPAARGVLLLAGLRVADHPTVDPGDVLEHRTLLTGVGLVGDLAGQHEALRRVGARACRADLIGLLGLTILDRHAATLRPGNDAS